MGFPRWQRLALACLLCISPRFLSADEPGLTKQQIREFLLTAKVIRSKATEKGVTSPHRLTLSNGSIVHDALFQSIDERKQVKELRMGSELNFVDSYKYNIAAYALAEMLGIDDMLPVTVERKWGGQTGSLSWWLPATMDEERRHKGKLKSPDSEAWNQQMYRIRVFNQLVYDTDPNLGNLLIGKEWQLWRVDFTRAFRLHHQLQRPADLDRCDRRLLEKLKALNAGELAGRTKGYLTRKEVEAVLARRDLLVAHFEKQVADKGADAVLY